MNEKSEMDILYEKYLEDANRIYEKDGIVFYKLVKKEKLSLGGGVVVITVPREAVHTVDDRYYDENGNRIFIDSPMHFKFRGEIPGWYMETVVLPVKGVSEVSEIGDYLGRMTNSPDTSPCHPHP